MYGLIVSFSEPPKMSVLFRRKRVESSGQTPRSSHGRRQLARRLSALDLVAIGVGSTIGAGVYILVGTVAREHTGPALPFAFLISGIAAALSALCYAELACRCPSAGSAYHYSYVCLGEGVAWLIGWALILEYTLGGAAVARGISPNLALFFGGEDRFPLLLARHTFFGVVIDPCAAIIVLVMTGLLCIGIKESSLSQAVITSVNISALIFVIIAGSYLGYSTGWPGYETQVSYLPFGFDGFLAGSAAVFFSYVGFDCITSTAEEVKHPQRDLPVGIGTSLSICVILYMVVSAVIVGLVPYNALDQDTPISSIFNTYGIRWAEYVITTGAVTALCGSLMGALLPQPRILLAMARDGLLPSFFSDISKHTQAPINSTIVTGIFVAMLSFVMDVSELADMVSVGTLLAFTIVAISVLILRYVPPEDVVSQRNRQSSDFVALQQDTGAQEIDALSMAKHPLLHKGASEGVKREMKRRKIATWCITLSCLGVLVLTSAASSGSLPRASRFIASGVGAVLIASSLVVLSCTDQADANHYVGHSGGFLCPWVPFLPVICVLINTYLLINLGASTWMKVSIWMAAGAVIYISYGRRHSLLNKNYAMIS